MITSLHQIGIVIVCYNGVADTVECLESLRKLTYTNFFTVVVDNASRDSTAEIVRAQFPEVTLIVNPQNTGFTGGNQTGVREVIQRGAEFIFLLNPDTIVAPDLLDHDQLEALLEGPAHGGRRSAALRRRVAHHHHGAAERSVCFERFEDRRAAGQTAVHQERAVDLHGREEAGHG